MLNYSKRAFFEKNGSHTEGNSRELSTPWKGIKASDRWVKFAKI